MTQKLPSISSLDLFGRKRDRDRDRDDSMARSPPPSLFQFPAELLPKSTFRHPYMVNSQSDPLIKSNSSTSTNSSASASFSTSSRHKKVPRQPSNNSGAINQRNHVKAKNQHSAMLRCDPTSVPALPVNWHERNNSTVKDKLGAVKDLYFSLTGEEWVDDD
ncbi:hypothetical protein E3P99_01674 [Wallemia hederae]|uniref:Uncharacterized protein n=1 Tax=Wallemia hederae TaxID=1540922 RepID=A0A4T0FQH7_9BASI|nr:hypothetical protein E3P99_01674 [Wallemia hederae]